MPRYIRADTGGGTYFFTVVAFARRPILCEAPFRTALRQAVTETRQTLPFTIDAWVLLPDHMHCIWTLPENDADFGKRWGLIKRLVSRHCPQYRTPSIALSASKKKRHESGIWQRRFYEHQIRNEADFQRHSDYLHYNPVKHSWVKQVKDWPYSSFHRYVRAGIYPENWGGEVETEKDDGLFGEPAA